MSIASCPKWPITTRRNNGGRWALFPSNPARVMLADVWPAPYLRDAWIAARALTEQRQDLAQADRFVGGLAEAERTTAKGVTVHDAGRAYQGYTLYTSGHDQAAFLIDMDGEVVHEWRTPFSRRVPY